MKISRLKFSKLIIGEIVAIVILFFVGLNYWVSGYNNMKYCRNFQKTVNFYSAGRLSDIGKGIRLAESADIHDKVPLYLFKANFFVEQGKYEQALSLYQEIETMVTSDDSQVNISVVGAAVCRLYLMGKDGEGINIEDLESLEKKMEQIAEDGCSDAYVVLGQIRLKQTEYFLADKESEFARKSLQKAQSAFKKAEKQHSPENSPLSRGSCFSFYVGQAMTYKYAADLLFAKEKRGGSKYPQRAEYLHKAARELRRAQLFRLPKKQNLTIVTAAFYGELLSIPWIEGERQRDLLWEVEDYESHACALAVRMAYMQNLERQQVSDFNLMTQNFLKQGLGSAYFSQGDYGKAVGKILYYYQLKFTDITKDWENKKKSGKLTIDDFITANNYLVLLYRQPRMSIVGVENVLKILKKTSAKFSSQRFFIAGHKDGITVEQILWHNLYMVHSYTKIKNIKKIMGRKPTRSDCLYPQK